MRIVGYDIIDEDEDTITVQREKISERFKFQVRFAIWKRDDKLMFGITDPTYTEFAGIPVKENRRKIDKFVNNLIKTGKFTTHYKYLGAVEEMPKGFLTEFIPTASREITLDEEMRQQLTMLKDKLKEVVE